MQPRYNQSLSLHRILGTSQYKAGALVLSPQDLIDKENAALGEGQAPTQVLPVELWAREYEEIDVFNWQEAVSGMISASDLEARTVRNRRTRSWRSTRGLVVPDHILPLGEKTYYYFRRANRGDSTGTRPAAESMTPPSGICSSTFVARMDMSSSYKPVLLLQSLTRSTIAWPRLDRMWYGASTGSTSIVSNRAYR